jgi:putative ABC transport system permease protein
MIKVSLKGMLGRKLRTALTAFAVVLGVAMVSGSYIVTDTMLNSADDLSAASYQGVDAVVSSKKAFETNTNAGFTEPKPIPASLLNDVRRVPEVQVAAGEITDEANLIGRDGKVIGADGGPTFAVGMDARRPEAAALSPFQFVGRGRFPTAPDEVAIDAGTAKDKGFAVGDTIGVQTRGPTERFTVVGVVTFGSVQSIGNATVAVFDFAAAQAMFKKEGVVDSILLSGADGVDQAALRAAVGPVLPPTAQVQTAAANDRFDLGSFKDFLGIFQKALVAFGLIALFVGSFIIFNTLSITVAQRSREFALLRTIGASRRQILRSVVLEAIVIGLVGSVVGILFGLGLAAGLQALFTSLGIDLPDSGTVIALRTILASLAVGVGVTLVAGLGPALRATRVAPVAALREGVTPPERRSKVASAVAIGTTVLGVAGLANGMFVSGVSVTSRLVSIGFGCILLFIGVAVLSRRIVRPLASVLGRPAERLGGTAGALARQNSMRNPGRTATTAAALMIGLALVTFVAVLGEGLRSSFGDSLDRQLDADYVLTAQDGFSPFQPEAAAALAKAPGVSVVTGVREDQVQAFGDATPIDGVDPATFGRLYKFDWTAGGSDAALAGLGSDGAVITKRFAEDHDLAVGERFAATSPAGTKLDLQVRGIDARPEFNPLSLANVTISHQLFDRTFETRKNRYVFVGTDTGSGAATTQQLQRTLADFPNAKLQTQDAYRKDAEKDIKNFLSLLYVLLALSVIVSLFGIVNTLVLAVFERTREVGMLRAVGMTRRQVRRMVRHESIIVALIGAVLGLVLGIFLAALVTRALSSEGITFAIPATTLIAFLVVAVAGGIVAAILPARRAARLDVLQALQYE